MTALICGSVAYDTVMVFQGRFREHILPDRIHMLNVAFLVPSLRRNFGGCAGNIAYNLKLLGGDGRIMATVGHDFGPYAAWLRDCGISTEYIRSLENEYTAQAYITTDLDDNQITAFHPGAMNHSQLNQVPANAGIRIGVIAPDGRGAMIEHAAQFARADIPYLFDPGQAMTLFDAADLRHFIAGARWLAVNDYEASLLCERTGLGLEAVAERVEALVVTRGAEGSRIHAAGEWHEIPAATPLRVADPTGCGDAYRAGLIYGLQKGYAWPMTGRVASLMGALKIEHHGTQNHRIARDQFAKRFQECFGMPLP
jgi:adenosine kinase